MWSNHGDWMGSMGGFMGLGWIVILIAIVAVVWLLMRGPLAGALRSSGAAPWTSSTNAMRAARSAAKSSSRRSTTSRLDAKALGRE